MLSDTMMFKCVDESVNLFGRFNENRTYYYHYAYRGTISTTMTTGVTADLGTESAKDAVKYFQLII